MPTIRRIITWPYRRFVRRYEARNCIKQKAAFDWHASRNVRITHRIGDGEEVLIRDFDQSR